jgi:hypothetical protein
MIVTLIFLDESGDTGFKFAFGSSRYFVVTMVIFNDPIHATQVDNAVNELRSKLHFPANREFRFSTGSSNEVKVEFLRALLPYSFRYRSLVVDKATFGDKYPHRSEEQLFEKVVSHLFDTGDLENVTLVIDRIVGGSFEQQLYVALRQYLKKSGKNPIRKFKDIASSQDNLLQVADMICGAVYRSYAREEDEFRRIIQAKEELVIEW